MRLLAAALVLALALVAAGCAPRTLRASICQAGPGVQVCSYAYEGDEEEGDK